MTDAEALERLVGEIKSLSERIAWPGEAYIEYDRNDQINLYVGDGDHWLALVPHQCVKAIEQEQEGNAALLVTLWNNRDALCDAVERMVGEVATLKQQIEHLGGPCDYSRKVEAVHELREQTQRENDALRAEVARLQEAITRIPTRFMDPPDGGDPAPIELVERLVADHERLSRIEVAARGRVLRLRNMHRRADKRANGAMTDADWVAQANDEHALARADDELSRAFPDLTQQLEERR
jgi:hypothetical protein